MSWHNNASKSSKSRLLLYLGKIFFIWGGEERRSLGPPLHLRGRGMATFETFAILHSAISVYCTQYTLCIIGGALMHRMLALHLWSTSSPVCKYTYSIARHNFLNVFFPECWPEPIKLVSDQESYKKHTHTDTDTHTEAGNGHNTDSIFWGVWGGGW